MQHETNTGPGTAQAMQGVGESLSRLVRDHLELARLELQESARKLARDSAIVAVGAAFALLGYVLLAVAISIGIGQAVGMARGFLLVSAFHVIVGGVLATVFVKRMQTTDKPGMPATQLELQRDKVMIGEVRQIVRRPAGSHR